MLNYWVLTLQNVVRYDQGELELCSDQYLVPSAHINTHLVCAMSSTQAFVIHHMHDQFDTGHILLDLGGLGFTQTLTYLNFFSISQRSVQTDQLLPIYLFEVQFIVQ